MLQTGLVCFRAEEVKDMRVVVGQGTLNINEAEEVVLDIDKLIMHPNWK